MGFFDDASQMLNRGVSAAKEGVSAAKDGVSDLAMERLEFMQGFINLCSEGYKQGWHERNGGNLSYRMSEEEVAQASKYFDTATDEWTNMGVQADNLANAYFVTTGTGRYMKNVEADPKHNIGIVEINDRGDAWRIVWGLSDGGRPTSEFPTHFMNHSVRMAASDNACRIIYHSHPANIIAMSFVCPLESRYFSRALWKTMTECVVIFPEGVGVVPWMVPGGAKIAEETSKLMQKFAAVVWAQHGLFVSGDDFDSTFGLMQTIEKAAEIYRMARQANGGSEDFLNTITDDGLREIGKDFNLNINEEFLD